MVNDIKTSLYCWLVLGVFILVTVIFMVNFYNRSVNEIISSYQGGELVTNSNL